MSGFNQDFNNSRNSQIAWISGFFDGEGCISICKQPYESSDGKRKHSHRLTVCISQNNYEVLQHFKDMSDIHGKIFKVKRTVDVNRQCYTLKYDARHAYRLLILMRPFLVRKGAEVDAIKMFWIEGQMETRGRTGRKPVDPEILAAREKWYRKLQKMK